MTAVLPIQTTRFDSVRHGDGVLYIHLPSGLTRDYATAAGIPAARLDKDFRATVMHLLGHPSTRPEDRIAAGLAVIDLEMVDAECVCGGYLTRGPERRWMHLDLCRWCVADPGACALGHEVRKMCSGPAPVQCGHNCHSPAGYGATRACGSDKDCCGLHGCDPAVAA